MPEPYTHVLRPTIGSYLTQRRRPGQRKWEFVSEWSADMCDAEPRALSDMGRALLDGYKKARVLAIPPQEHPYPEPWLLAEASAR